MMGERSIRQRYARQKEILDRYYGRVTQVVGCFRVTDANAEDKMWDELRQLDKEFENG